MISTDRSSLRAGAVVTVAELNCTPPFSPWLRLAHRWSHNGSDDVRARLRVLHDCEWILQLEGTSWIYLPDLDGSVLMPPGSIALIPPGLVHAQGPETSRHLAVHFDLHAQTTLHAFDMFTLRDDLVGQHAVDAIPMIRLQLGHTTRLAPLITQVPDLAAWTRRFDPLITQWTLRTLDRPGERLAAAGVLATAMADWLALSASPAPAPLTALLAEVDVCDRRLTVATLARRAGLGETAFRSAVKAATGRSPRRWIEERRHETALRLLRETALPIATVATACGYDDPFHFSRVCRRLSGKPPSALRG